MSETKGKGSISGPHGDRNYDSTRRPRVRLGAWALMMTQRRAKGPWEPSALRVTFRVCGAVRWVLCLSCARKAVQTLHSLTVSFEEEASRSDRHKRFAINRSIQLSPKNNIHFSNVAQKPRPGSQRELQAAFWRRGARFTRAITPISYTWSWSRLRFSCGT